ncbi:MAG: nitrate- and nitrite sensing domain-containing protein [Dechloromonas sp.]|nr:nitrate- and nitrite sensing domain-containing protein [Dechloromonas sp.]
MTISVQDIVLAAKRLEIDELRQLAAKARLVGVIGQLVHCLQMERGVSSIYLASAGARFSGKRSEVIRDNEVVDREVRQQFEKQLAHSAFGSARLFSLMAWVLLGLDALAGLREEIRLHQLKADEAVLAYSRLIAGFMSLIFEVADAAIDPDISRSLVTLFHFIQGKEQAGQERAIGALCFAGGCGDHANQQRVQHLIDAQERNFDVFKEYTDGESLARWTEQQVSPAMAGLERLRRILLTAKAGSQLDSELSAVWFDCCTERITGMWALQCQIVAGLEAQCTQLIAAAERHLEDAQGLIEGLRQHPPASAEGIERFFDPDVAIDPALQFLPMQRLAGSAGQSMIAVLQEQSARLASVEGELDKARRALNEHKVIERAKGVMMARFALSEEAAHKMLRRTAMDQNRRILEVAEAALVLPSLLVER